MYYDFLSNLLESDVAKCKIMFQITSEIFQDQDLKNIKNLTICGTAVSTYLDEEVLRTADL